MTRWFGYEAGAKVTVALIAAGLVTLAIYVSFWGAVGIGVALFAAVAGFATLLKA